MSGTLLRAMAAQVLGLAAAWGLAQLAGIWGWWLVPVQAAGAALASRLLGQPGWWVPIHLVFLPAATGLLALGLPPLVYLLGFLGMVLVFWGTAHGDVPLFLSSPAVASALGRLAAQERARHVGELGAGLGSVVVPLARRHPALDIEAWEKAPLPWAITALRCEKLANVKVYRKDFWACDLSHYDVVFVFLSPLPMGRLGEKARREMRRGSLLVSSSFAVPGWEPEQVLTTLDKRGTRLYCYRM